MCTAPVPSTTMSMMRDERCAAAAQMALWGAGPFHTPSRIVQRPIPLASGVVRPSRAPPDSLTPPPVRVRGRANDAANGTAGSA